MKNCETCPNKGEGVCCGAVRKTQIDMEKKPCLLQQKF